MSYLHHKVHLEMNYSGEKFLVNITEELKQLMEIDMLHKKFPNGFYLTSENEPKTPCLQQPVMIRLADERCSEIGD